MKIKAFYSDPHYGHKNIIKYSNRPYADVEHMTYCMIENYNSLISDTDTVMWLGDCTFYSCEKFKKIMDSLNGRKFLVKGNHDKSNHSMLDVGFDLVMDECFLQISGRNCRLKHFPYITGEPSDCRKDDRYASQRPPQVDGEILIHGHTHSQNKVFKNMVHVGVDAWNYRPALLTEIEELISKYFPI